MIRKRPFAFDQPPGWPALMTGDIVCAYFGDISRQLLYRWSADPDFPAPTRIPGVKRWSRSALDAWILARDPPAHRSPQTVIAGQTSVCPRASPR